MNVPYTAQHSVPVERTNVVKEKPKFGYVLLGLPAIFPLLCLIPDIAARNGADLDIGIADVAGTGAEICLFLALLITPLILVTGIGWFKPLRQWFGIMAGIIALSDATIASITTIEFSPTPIGRLTDHIFLMIGFLMVMCFIPLLMTANNRSQKMLGKYWPKLHKLTYVIWFLLGVHLALLFNLGLHSGGSIVHQRFYQYLLCSIALIVYRLPIMRKSVLKLRRLRFNWAIWIMSLPWLILFVVPFSFIVNEEVFKGIAVMMGHASNN
jgi:DMSO/TMAO reductase YedYZ heme-binding membrane subunit